MKTGRPADISGMTRFMHRCGAALQFVMWLTLWVVLALAFLV